MSKPFGFRALDTEFPATEDGRSYHVGVKPGDVPPYVLVPGSPERCELVNKLWKDISRPAQGTRLQYNFMRGKFTGTDMSICSTGIGAPASEIAIFELMHGGGRKFFRVGTCGCIDPYLNPGDMVITTEAKGNYGVVREYLGSLWTDKYIPSDKLLVECLENACKKLGVKEVSEVAHSEERERGSAYKLGRTYSSDSFYHGQGRKVFAALNEVSGNLIEELTRERVIDIEMEIAGMNAIMKSIRERGYIEELRNVGSGMIATVVANRVTGDWYEGEDMQLKALQIASEAFHILDKS